MAEKAKAPPASVAGTAAPNPVPWPLPPQKHDSAEATAPPAAAVAEAADVAGAWHADDDDLRLYPRTIVSNAVSPVRDGGTDAPEDPAAAAAAEAASTPAYRHRGDAGVYLVDQRRAAAGAANAGAPVLPSPPPREMPGLTCAAAEKAAAAAAAAVPRRAAPGSATTEEKAVAAAAAAVPRSAFGNGEHAVAHSSAPWNTYAAAVAEAELDEAFLGLRVTDPAKMNPAHDYTSGPAAAAKSLGANATGPNFGGSSEPAAAAGAASSSASTAEGGKDAVRGIFARVKSVTSRSSAVPKTPQSSAPSAQAASSDTPRAARDVGAPTTAETKPAAATVAPSVTSAPRATAAAAVQSGTVTLRMDQVKQTIIGVGYSNAFYTNYWHTAHPYSNEIYDRMLAELQPSMLRLRNHYGINAQADMTIDAEFYQIAKTKLGYTPFVLLTGWSPPASLKVSGMLNGSNKNPGTTDVLKKDASGKFIYGQFAKYWVDSLNAYSAMGVKVDYYSPQNEPDYSASGSPTCVFGAVETSNIPGIYNASSAVSSAVKVSVRNPPKMVGPECTGVQNYLAEFPFGGGGQFAAIAGHLYGSGNWLTTFDPASFNSAMVQAKNFSVQKGLQNLWMTEFAKLGAFDYQDPLKYAIIMQNAFTLADMSVYLHWDGAWGLPNSGTPTEGSMILVDNPFVNRSQWRNPRGYQILHSFWWFKHFTRFVRPTYRRVQCDLSGLSNMLVTAWTGLNGEFSIIFVNTGTTQANITLRQIPAWISNQITDRYYSTLDVGFTYSGRFFGNFISLPPLSITSLFSYHL